MATINEVHESCSTEIYTLYTLHTNLHSTEAACVIVYICIYIVIIRAI